MWRRLTWAAIIGVTVAGIASTFFLLGVFESWQARLSDTLFLPRRASSEIVIIAIDEKSIAAIGRWPWNRRVHADLITKLQAPNPKPKTIGVDVSFFEESNPADDQILAEAIKLAGNVVLAAEEVDGRLILPLYDFSQYARVGVVNTMADGDGITRRLKTQFGPYPHFTSVIAGKEPSVIENGYLRINFVGRPKSFATYSYIDILNGQITPEVFAGKIVLVGATAPNLHDDQMVPTSRGVAMAGVEIHANALQTILEDRYLELEPKLQTLLVIWAGAFLISLLSVLAPIGVGLIGLVALAGVYGFYVFAAFDNGKILNIIYPTLTMFLAYIVSIVYKYFSEFSQKRFIKKAFSYYLSPAVMQELLDHPAKLKLGGERKMVTVLFSDIEGFTTFSEKTQPEKLANFLNEYLTRMTEIVFKYDGVLDKYIGDAVMAFWGAPVSDADQALKACRAAQEMQQVASSLGHGRFKTRIGIHMGEMIVGNMGSQQRFDYTLLGDNVNLGSRLEGINKEYGTSVIISEAVYKKIEREVIARKLDRVAVKGKSRSVTIYELRGLGKPDANELVFLQGFEKARHLYETGNFAKALKEFKLLSKKYPHDGPTKTYLTRIQRIAKDPVKTWDGVYKAKTK